MPKALTRIGSLASYSESILLRHYEIYSVVFVARSPEDKKSLAMIALSLFVGPSSKGSLLNRTSFLYIKAITLPVESTLKDVPIRECQR